VRRLVPALAVLGALLVGCSTVPTSSPNVVITQAPHRSDEPTKYGARIPSACAKDGRQPLHE